MRINYVAVLSIMGFMAAHGYSLEDGAILVRAARNAIELSIRSPRFDLNSIRRAMSGFTQDYDLTVSLYYYPTNESRGSFGVLMHGRQVGKVLVDHALSAAFNDARHVPVSDRDIDDIVVEVCITSKPVLLKSISRRRAIKAGREGVILRYGTHMSVVTPEEARSKGWNAEQMLEHACAVAGISKHHWKQPNVRLYKFEVQMFKETSPNGEIVEVR